MGLWLLRVTAKMLANLRITVSIFPLWSPESFFLRFLTFSTNNGQTAKFLAFLRQTVNPIETLH